MRASEFFKANLKTRRIFINAWYTGKDEPLKEYMLWPVGLVNEVGAAVSLNAR